jgi:hypothetical protein
MDGAKVKKSDSRERVKALDLILNLLVEEEADPSLRSG